MRKIVVFMNLTMDGVMQAPGSPDEDTRGGFEYGGWANPYGAMQTPEAGEALADGMGSLLLGRVTYERFYAFWPKQKDSPFSEMLNNMPKYLASNTIKEPEWQNTTLLKGDVVEALNALKTEGEGNIVIMGSGNLIQTLMKNNVVDKYVLMIHPLTLGTGFRLFADGAALAKYRLVSSKPTSTGVIVATYEPAS